MATLWNPRVINYSGSQLLEGDFDSTAAMSWGAEIALSDCEDDEGEPLTVGQITFITARLSTDTADMLDAHSADAEIFAELFVGEFLAAGVEDQFDGCPIGIILLEHAYLHPAVRGRDLGAWAVAEVIHHLGFAGLFSSLATPALRAAAG
jgi:hypothetical protein